MKLIIRKIGHRMKEEVKCHLNLNHAYIQKLEAEKKGLLPNGRPLIDLVLKISKDGHDY